MENDDVDLHYYKTKNKRRCRCIAATLALVVLFIIGILIGYFIGKAAQKTDSDAKEKVKDADEIRKERQKTLRDSIDSEEMAKASRFFSQRPHIAGSLRQKQLAEELVKRWRGYGFNKVEMMEYKVLLSSPQKDKRNVVSLKYKNGTIAFQTSGKPKIAEKSEDDPDVVPPFLGYSPSGTVEGDLVYVNYGRIEDFKHLVEKLNMSASGKIAIMRYGKIFRGDKVHNAATYGAIGAIIYSDPQDYAPLGPNNTFPKTPFLPSTGVQRGSIYTAHGMGDPLTPGRPAIPGIYRRPVNESDLPSIPAHPMSYGDAIHFLSKLQGHTVPEDWKGSLDITYRLGPGFVDRMKVKLEIHNEYNVSSIFNVIGTIYGKEEPDRYVLMGNHRDSWVFGAVDAVSGTSTTTEVARGLGKLLKNKGWRPRRTVVMCSWGGEEYALIGSIEYVEEHVKDLALKAIAYINLDSAVSGNWVMAASGSPLFKEVVASHEKVVNDPNAHGEKQNVYDIMVERNPSADGKAKYSLIGSGSDFAHFYHYIGVPVLDLSYKFGFNNKTAGYPVYHTQHDTYYWLKTFIDPKFLFHKSVAQLGGSLLLELADAPLLPLNLMEYVAKLNSSFHSLKVNDHLKKQSISLEYIEEAINKFMKAAGSFDRRLEDYRKRQDQMNFAELRRINDQVIQVEKSFIHPDGLYGRRLVKHVLFAPEMHNTYGVSSFPGINDAIFDAESNGKWIEVKKQISHVVECLNAAVEALQSMDMTNS